MKVFISHSSRDGQFATLLVDLLRSSLNLSAGDIRCTSVDGHRLPGGAMTDKQIRDEVLSAEAFIGLMSAASTESAYVLFELGARWGAGQHLLPILVPGADPSILKGPISGRNALSCGSAAELHQFVHDLADTLGIQAEKPQAYQRRVEELLRFAVAPGEEPRSVQADTSKKRKIHSETARSTTSETSEDAEKVIQDHCESQWPDNFSMRAYCIKEQRKAVVELARGRPDDIPEEVFTIIRRKCARQWPDNFAMRLYCEQEQMKSYRELQG